MVNVLWNSLLILLVLFVELSSLCSSLPVQSNLPLAVPDTSKVRANRPDHLNAVPLERDGHINKELRKELLLGKKGAEPHGHEHMDLDPKELIKHMLKCADTDLDGKLSRAELTAKMKENIEEHLNEAKKSSSDLFQKIDSNGDGKVDWDEYKIHFMVEKNLVDADHAKEHSKHDQNLDSDSRFMLDEEKASFQRADADGDGLDEVEWLTFQHPEHSHVMLEDLAKDIMKALDTNKDGVLNVDEFSQLPAGVVEGDSDSDDEYQQERVKEFKEFIDLNKDGKADKDELIAYLNPTSAGRIADEVKEIFDIADLDSDGYLNLAELLNNAENLASSSFLKPKLKLHEDL